MTENYFLYKNNGKGYLIGDDESKGSDGKLYYSNGIKSEYINVIESIVVPRTYENIKIYRLEYRCFSNLPKLKKAFIPNTITELGGDLFNLCYSLESVVFEENMKLKSLANHGFRCTNLTFIDIPSSVNELRDRTFAEMKNLRVIYIHSYIKSIHSATFYNTNTENLKIFVPRDYPNETILGLPILKVLNPYKKQKTRCVCRTSKATCFIIINILLSA